MSGSMLGGAAAGIGAAVKLWQDQQRIDMEREHNDLTNQLMGYQVKKAQKDAAADEEMGQIADQEASDNSLEQNQGVLKQSATDALAENGTYDPFGPNDTSNSQDTAANQDIKAAEDSGVVLTDQEKNQIRKSWGLGLKPQGVRSYEYALKRADVYRSKGDWKTAKELEDQAHSDASGNFISAILSKDGNRAAQYYNLFAGTQQGTNPANAIKFDDSGNLNVIRQDGSSAPVTTDRAIALALAQMKPEAAAQFVQRQEFQGDKTTQALLALALRQSGGIGGGTGGTRGAGAAIPGGQPAPGAVKDITPLIKTRLDYYAKDGGGIKATGADGKATTINPGDVVQPAQSLFNDIMLANRRPDGTPGIDEARASMLATDAAIHDLGGEAKYFRKASIDPATGNFNLDIVYKDAQGNIVPQATVGKNIANPERFGMTPEMRQKAVDSFVANTFKGDVEKIKATANMTRDQYDAGIESLVKRGYDRQAAMNLVGNSYKYAQEYLKGHPEVLSGKKSEIPADPNAGRTILPGGDINTAAIPGLIPKTGNEILRDMGGYDSIVR